MGTEELTAMEVEVLKALQFELTVPTVMNYAERYSKVGAHYLGKSREIKIISDLIMYCSEHCVVNYQLAQLAPSLTGAACFVYACLSTKVFAETAITSDGLEQVMGYSLAELVPCMRILDINARMRTVLVDWLIEVHRKFKLSQAAYFLGINMVDRYLAKRQVKRTNLQLLGCTCLWIASKYHEIYAPEMDDFVYISDNAFSTEELTAMEVEVLKTLGFELTVPTVMNY